MLRPAFRRPQAMPLLAAGLITEPDWEFFLPDDEPDPDPGDFWIEPPDEE